MEGFSRVLWARGPLWQGGGEALEFEEVYRRGLAAGTDPENPEYWSDPGEYDQLFVEMAAIACAILEAPQKVWFPLEKAQQNNLARWLETINHHQLPLCNWLGFRILVNLALRSVGMPWDAEQMEKDLEELESWYIGDGWYSDGSPLVKPQRAARLRERALAFGREYQHWFDENGAAIPYGRSLSYRFAQCAFYSVCVWAGLQPLSLEVMKGIIQRKLQ